VEFPDGRNETEDEPWICPGCGRDRPWLSHRPAPLTSSLWAPKESEVSGFSPNVSHHRLDD
jgi:hypothetical protein